MIIIFIKGLVSQLQMSLGRNAYESFFFLELDEEIFVALDLWGKVFGEEWRGFKCKNF